jgi:hypothetical protein
MASGIKLYFIFKSTIRATGQYYYGIHGSYDSGYGSEQTRDPYVGNGTKLVQIIKQDNLNRSSFVVNSLYMGTQAECALRYAQLKINYNDPKCLNLKEGAPLGTVKDNDARFQISESMKGNTNGARALNDADTQVKWINNGNESIRIRVPRSDSKAIPAIYRGYVWGRLAIQRNKRRKRARPSNVKHEVNAQSQYAD